ncbi:WUSCHEL-related homeobox 9-like [Olea europaea subsp. europaea]|uniref:Protein WUSCHEL n=1 Tax=Olea europaea subsp. europaea TaxID=158383 RepID=A0A8S0U9R2_OLEEU|nr:WUSCHEL-related homeobox 9-like [Olea europaea subsp. europaea]
MGSSNKNWQSTFKSNSCTTTTHHLWLHGINSSIMSTGCQKPTYTSVTGAGGEERTLEPKPRWNPRPEQIQILEAIFNSGMVNPSRDEIKKIRGQLQEYGQVGDANVFYWFQNRKSRSKQKQRQLQNTNTKSQSLRPITTISSTLVKDRFSSSSSSSSDKTSPNSTERAFSVGSTSALNASTSPTSSVNQHFFQAPSDLIADPFFFPVQQGHTAALPQGFCFPNVSDQSNHLLGDFMWMNKGALKKAEYEKIKLQEQLSHVVATSQTFAHTIVPPSFTFPSPINPIQGIGNSVQVPKKSTVFIDDACFEVVVGPFNVRDTFGEGAMLVHSSGLPIVTDEWGMTLHPLQDGGFYYLVRSFTSSPYE